MHLQLLSMVHELLMESLLLGTKQGKTGVAKISLNAHYAFNTIQRQSEITQCCTVLKKELMDKIGMVKLPERFERYDRLERRSFSHWKHTGLPDLLYY